MFSLSQLLRTLDTSSPADCNSTLDISQFFFFFLAFWLRAKGVEGNAAWLLKKTSAYLNVKKPVRSRLWLAFIAGEAGGAEAGAAEALLPQRAVAFIKAKVAPGSAAFTTAGSIQEMAFSPTLNLIPNGNINLLLSDGFKAAGREERGKNHRTASRPGPAAV